MSNYLIDVPVVWLSRSDDFVLYGTRNLNIDCWISTPDYPLLSVVWQKTRYGVTTQLNVAISNGKYSGSSLVHPGLTINNAEFTDSGSYVCIATNLLGNGYSPAYELNIYASKSFSVV